MTTLLRHRLLSRLVADRQTGCLLWQGCVNSKGYGVISDGGKRYLVHRKAWELANGPIPDGLTIDHVYDRGCRHKNCANVAHLEPVTQAENNRRSLPFRPRRYKPRQRRQSGPSPAYLAMLNDWLGGDTTH